MMATCAVWTVKKLPRIMNNNTTPRKVRTLQLKASIVILV
jgi:hypothetical protein